MLGIVLAENLIFMPPHFFWELTSLISFLLIGFYGNKPNFSARCPAIIVLSLAVAV